MDIIAHRGFADHYAENTLGAVLKASKHADMVEIDVRRCGSGELVVIHDETVDRVSESSGKVSEISAEKLGELDVLGSGDSVPTLGEVFENLDSDTGLNVELKEVGLAEDAIETFEKHENDVIVSSFEETALHEVVEARDANADIPTAYLFMSQPQESIRIAEDLGCEFVHPEKSLCSQDFVAKAHKKGFRVNAWTAKNRKGAEKLVEAGVDGIISDRYDIF